MLKILQAHPLRAFVAILKIDAIYALYPESFCDKNLAVRKVFAFSDSEGLRFRFRLRFRAMTIITTRTTMTTVTTIATITTMTTKTAIEI